MFTWMLLVRSQVSNKGTSEMIAKQITHILPGCKERLEVQEQGSELDRLARASECSLAGMNFSTTNEFFIPWIYESP